MPKCGQNAWDLQQEANSENDYLVNSIFEGKKRGKRWCWYFHLIAKPLLNQNFAIKSKYYHDLFLLVFSSNIELTRCVFLEFVSCYILWNCQLVLPRVLSTLSWWWKVLYRREKHLFGEPLWFGLPVLWPKYFKSLRGRYHFLDR